MVDTIWFWLIVVGLLLMIGSALVSGGMNKTTGWTWAVFVIGAALTVAGFIWALVQWIISGRDPLQAALQDQGEEKFKGLPKEVTYVPQVNVDMRSPQSQSLSYSIPDPQAQRGFAATSLGLSTLAP